jgi:hypothetical protein
MRELDTQEYVSMLKELVEEGHQVSLLISGSSMLPFLIHHRDTIYFQKPDRELQVGDMVFYRRSNGKYVMHRICRIRPEGFYMIGDGQKEIEGPLNREQIFGLVTAVKRKGKLIQPGNFWWEFFARVWPRIIPLRGIISRIYSKLF